MCFAMTTCDEWLNVVYMRHLCNKTSVTTHMRVHFTSLKQKRSKLDNKKVNPILRTICFGGWRGFSWASVSDKKVAAAG